MALAVVLLSVLCIALAWAVYVLICDRQSRLEWKYAFDKSIYRAGLKKEFEAACVDASNQLALDRLAKRAVK